MIHAIAQRLDDTINPVVVKELRQAVQGRFVASILGLFLVISLVTLGLFLFLEEGVTNNFDAGRGALMAFQGVLTGMCLLFLPVYAGVRMAAERSDENTDLLFITTIRPRSIIWGKLLATTILAVLVYSACMPFMTLTYLLRGVDLPTIFLVLVMGFLLVIAAVQMALFLACVTTHRAARVLLGLVLIGELIMLFWIVMGGTWGITFEGVASRMNSWDFWGPALSIVVIGGMSVGLLNLWAVAMIKPVSANRAMPVRIYLTVCWLLSALMMWIWMAVARDGEVIEVWAVFTAIGIAGAFLVAGSERDRWGPRVARTIPRNTLVRMIAFFFYSGSFGGMLWAAAMTLLTVAATIAAGAHFRSMTGRNSETSYTLGIVIGLAFYGYLYSVAGMLTQRYILRRWTQPSHSPLLAMLIAALALAVPALAARLIYGFDYWNPDVTRVVMLGNPGGLFDSSYQFFCQVFAGFSSAVVTILALPHFVAQMAAFRPLEPTRPAPDTRPTVPA
jgi:hypothetical protein